MKLIEQIKRLFNGNTAQNITAKKSKSTNLSIIDITNIEIDRILTKEENESRQKLFEEISSGNVSVKFM